MADNFNISTPDGNKVIASDDISSVWHQRVKIVHGKDGTADSDAAKYVSATDTTAFPVTNYPASDFMSVAGAAVVPKFQYKQLTSGAPDAVIVAAATGKKIRILCMVIHNETVDDDLELEDGSGGTTLMKWTNMAANQTIVLPFNPVGWQETTSGNALYGDSTIATGPIDILVTYIEV